jgi:prepilin signal peptidase PulO-like enzyme (type II secretory pathway)
MAYEAMFATSSPFLVIYDNTTKASINLLELTELEPLTLAWMLTIIQTPPRSNFPRFDLMFTFSLFGLKSLKSLVSILEPTCKLKPHACFGLTFSPFGIKSPKSPKAKGSKKTSKT